MPHQLGFQTARTNHIKSVCALHTDEEAEGAKGCKEDKNIFAFFATFCAFCLSLLRNWNLRRIARMYGKAERISTAIATARGTDPYVISVCRTLICNPP
jgi:hypothetical protein